MAQTVTIREPVSRQQILSIFRNDGYTQNSLVSLPTLTALMDKLSLDSKGHAFNKDVLDEIWNEAETNSQGMIAIGVLADIFVNAQNILNERIEKLSEPNGLIEGVDKRIKEKELELKEYTSYYPDDRQKINQLTKDLIDLQIQHKRNQNDLKNFMKDYKDIGDIFNNGGDIRMDYNQVQTIINTPVPKNDNLYDIQKAEVKKSTSQQLIPTYGLKIKDQNQQKLLYLFFMTVGLLLVQLLIMSSLRLWILPLTVYLHSLFVLLLGLYSQNAILYLVGHCGLSIVGDIAFIVLSFMKKYTIMPFHHSSSEVYLTILFFFLIITIIVRIAFMVFYFGFRNTYSSSTTPYFTFAGHKFYMQPNKQALIQSGFSPNAIVHRETEVVRPEKIDPPKFENPFSQEVESKINNVKKQQKKQAQNVPLNGQTQIF